VVPAHAIQPLTVLLCVQSDSTISEATEQRLAKERHLLQVYHNALVAGGVTHFTFDDCFLAYRKAVLYLIGFTAHAAALPLISGTERGRLVYGQWLSRLESAIVSLDVEPLLPAE
jgi:hypothetical protein